MLTASTASVLGTSSFLVAEAPSRARLLSRAAWAYWLTVVGVGVFGTMAADVLHVGFGVPYVASSILYGVGKPDPAGGLGWGDGTVALILTFAIVCLVGYLSVTRRDVQSAGAPAYGAAQL